MDPNEILNVRFHFGGKFVRVGPNLDYVGDEDVVSEIERDNLSLPKVKGFAKDHLQLKESMKFYFLILGADLLNGLVFLHDDKWYLNMADYTCVGGVADVYIEYHQEQENRSGSDFEKRVWELSDDEDDHDAVITASPTVRTSQAQAPQAARKSQGEDPPAARTRQPCPARSQPTRFRTPRKRTATSEAGSSVVSPQTGPSGNRGRGTRVPTAKKGRKVAASSFPVYSYFTCSANH